MAYDDSAVGVAEDDLGSHVYELVNKEESALKHYLMDEDWAFGLCRYNEHDAQKVWGESWPWGISEGHGAAVHEGCHFIVVLFRYMDVIVDMFELDAKPAEHIGDDAEVVVADILDGYVAASHGCHAYEGAYLYHVRQDGVLCAMECGDTFDGEQIGPYAGDVGSHGVEHAAELLDVGLAGCVVDGGDAFGKNGRHDDVGCACDAGFIEQHVFACEFWCGDVIDIMFAVVCEVCSEFVYADEMGVKAASAYLVPTWFGYAGSVETSEQWAEHEDAASQLGASLCELHASEVVHVEIVRLESPCVVAHVDDSYSHLAEEVDEIVDIEDVWYILDGDGVGRKQYGSDDFEGFVFGSLRCYLSVELVASFNYE